MIPKRIFYAWFGGETLPPRSKAYIEKWQKLNPDFEIIRIDEKNFNVNLYNFTKEAYKSHNWAFVSDVARLDAIYKYGGFYFDTDVELIKPITKLLNYKSIWALEQSNAIASGLIIGARKNDEDIKNILNIYSKKKFEEGKIDIITVHIISKYFRERGFISKNKLQKFEDGTTILPTEYFAPFHYWGGGSITKNTIGIHHYNAGWVKEPHYGRKFQLEQTLLLHFPSLYQTLYYLKNGVNDY